MDGLPGGMKRGGGGGVCDVFSSSRVTRSGCLCMESVLFTAGDKLIGADSGRDGKTLEDGQSSGVMEEVTETVSCEWRRR